MKVFRATFPDGPDQRIHADDLVVEDNVIKLIDGGKTVAVFPIDAVSSVFEEGLEPQGEAEDSED